MFQSRTGCSGYSDKEEQQMSQKYSDSFNPERAVVVIPTRRLSYEASFRSSFNPERAVVVIPTAALIIQHQKPKKQPFSENLSKTGTFGVENKDVLCPLISFKPLLKTSESLCSESPSLRLSESSSIPTLHLKVTFML